MALSLPPALYSYVTPELMMDFFRKAVCGDIESNEVRKVIVRNLIQEIVLYGISENGSLFEIYSNNAYFRDMVTNTVLHGAYPDPYWTDASFDGLIRGSTTDQYHVEPELIRFLLDIHYNHAIGYTFHKDISSVDSYNTPDDIYALYRSIKAGDKKIIKQQGAYWIDLVNNSGDFTAHLYNYAAMDNGDVPSNVFTTSADGKTISGSIWLWWHPYLAGNAYNNVTDEIPIIEIILSVE